MSFLTPLFLLGLAGLAIPVILHLIQKERKNVVQFPSLMFLRKIPYQSVQRRRIRHWLLLFMRLAALALIVLAFTRPFLRQSEILAGASGAREVVVLLDRSYSMGYGDKWAKAMGAAQNAINGLTSSDRASLVFFSTSTEVALRSAADKGRLLAAVSGVQPGAGATRYGPALKLAGSILSESALPRREAILITDFQRGGWQGSDGVRLPDGAVLTPMAITDTGKPNLAIAPVALQQSEFQDQQRIIVTSGAVNHSASAASDVSISLEIGGRAIQTRRLNVAASGSASTTFDPVTVARAQRPRVRAARRRRARARQRVSFRRLAGGAGPRRDRRARRRAAQQQPVPRASRRGQRNAAHGGQSPSGGLDLERRLVVGGRRHPQRRADCAEHGGSVEGVRRGRRRAVRRARRARRVAVDAISFPRFRDLRSIARAAQPRGSARSSTGIRSSKSSAVRGRATSPRRASTAIEASRRRRRAPASRRWRGSTMASAALVERKAGTGRVLMWTSTLDTGWTDLALKPVFVPFVHRVIRHLGGYQEPKPWRTVGDVVDPGLRAAAPAAHAGGPGQTPSRASDISRVAIAPGGQRISLDGDGPEVLELAEQGFYEFRAQGQESDEPVVVASNVNLAESDLASLDPHEIVAAAMGRAGGDSRDGPPPPPTDEAQESAQRVWWYLLFAGLVLLGAETVVANRLTV